MRIKRGFSKCGVWVWGLAFLACLPLAAQPQVIAVKAKKIYTATGGIIENGIILIQDGKILNVGSGLEIPWNATTIDYSKKVIIPGLVEAHAARGWGYDAANETNPLTPFVTVRDIIDTSHDDFKTALKSGVTAMNIMPGHATILGGLGSLVKTVGLVVEDTLIIPDSGMKISVAGTPSQTRMGVMAQLRRYFNETKDYMEKPEAAAGERMVSTPGSFRSPERVKYEAVADLLRGRYRAFVYCENSSDIRRAYDLGKKYGYDSVFILGPECYKAAEFIAANKLKVILDPELVYFERDPLTEETRRIDVARVFHDKGVVFALQSNPLEIHSRSLLYQAMQAMAGGLSAEEALEAVTIVPARFLGGEGLLGSLEKGKLAHFTVLDDEPFKVSAKVEFVYIDGKPVYERDKDEELKKLMEGKPIK